MKIFVLPSIGFLLGGHITGVIYQRQDIPYKMTILGMIMVTSEAQFDTFLAKMKFDPTHVP